MSFLNPWALLIGGLALLGPLWTHWIHRALPKRMKFGSFQWIPEPDTLRRRRKNLRYWPLLLLRMALIILAALAFAKPQWMNLQGLESRERETAVWIVDRSFSLLARDESGDSLWEVQMSNMKQHLESLHPETDLRILPTPKPVSLDWPEGFLKPAEWQGFLNNLEPSSFGDPDGISKSLRIGALAFRELNTEWPQGIVVYSDFQNHALLNLDEVQLPENVAVTCVKSGPMKLENHTPTFVSEIRDTLNTSKRSALDPPVESGSYRVFPPATGVLKVTESRPQENGTTPKLEQVDAANNSVLELNYLGADDGVWIRKLEWDQEDALLEDNVSYDVFAAPRPVPFLMAEPGMSGPSFERELFFVGKALDPYSGWDDAAAAWSYYRTSFVSIRDWNQRAQAAFEEFGPRLTLVTPDLSSGDASRVFETTLDLVESGATAWFFLGKEYQPDVYQRILGDVCDLQFGPAVDVNSSAPLETVGASHPVWGDWDSSLRRWLRRIPIRRRAIIEMGSGPQALARFEDGAPLILAQSHGKGSIVIWNISADREWTDWQTSGALFAPTIIRMAQWNFERGILSGEDGSNESQVLAKGTITAQPNLILPASDQEIRVRVGEHEGTLSASGLWTPDSEVELKPGLEEIVLVDGARIGYAVWNLDPEESLCEYTSGIAIQRQLESQRRALSGAEQSVSALKADRQESTLWKWLLILALVGWNFEIIFANRTSPLRNAA